jgi:hypothetical protein
MAYRTLLVSTMQNLPAYAEMIGCAHVDVATAIERTQDKKGASGTRDNKEIILQFLHELYSIRHAPKHYLTFSYLEQSSYTSWSIHAYLYLDEVLLPKYKKIVNSYNKVNIDHVTIDKYRIYDLEIETCPAFHGVPSHDGCSRRPAPEDILKILAKIPDNPSVFMKHDANEWYIFKEGKQTTFSADQTAMRKLFGDVLSMDKVNYFIYMGIHFSMEAGRGDKWFLKVENQLQDKIKTMIICNTGGTDLEPKKFKGLAGPMGQGYDSD